MDEEQDEKLEKIIDQVGELEKELAEEIERIGQKYDVPIYLVANVAVSLANRMAVIQELYDFGKDNGEDFSDN